MFRSLAPSLVAAVALAGVAPAQQRFDSAKIHPVTVPIRDAGVFDWQTKQWVSGPKAHQLLASQYTVYRNDCTWVTQAYYFGTPECWDVVDVGLLPSTTTPLGTLPGVGPNGVHIESGIAISGITDDQIISSAQFRYCTYTLAGSVDIKVGFYDSLRGNCAGGQAVKGKPFNLTLKEQAIPFGDRTAYFDFGVMTDFPLPGSSVAGNRTCWAVTITFPSNAGFCMQSSGNGSWSNSNTEDKFSWSFEHDNIPFSATQDDGLVMAGDPSQGGWGTGSYNIPAYVDPSTGETCGTGFGDFDGWWMNVDGSSQSMPGPCSPVTSGCYWFGGWPGNPLGSFWLVLGSTGSCSGCSNRPATYCTAGTSSSGCQALISAVGSSSATAASGFFVKAVNVEGNKSGLFFYGTKGPKAGGATPWGHTSSFQCIEPPLRHGAAQAGVGTNGLCDSFFSLDLNAQWTAKPNRNPGAGAQVDGQYLYRDSPGPAPGSALSNAISWTVCP